MQHLHSHKLLAMPTDMSIVIRRVAFGGLRALRSACFLRGDLDHFGQGDEGYRETCSWLREGRRHIVCRARDQTANVEVIIGIVGPSRCGPLTPTSATQTTALRHSAWLLRVGGLNRSRGSY